MPTWLAPVEERQREPQEGLPSRLLRLSMEPDMGLELSNHEIVT